MKTRLLIIVIALSLQDPNCTNKLCLSDTLPFYPNILTYHWLTFIVSRNAQNTTIDEQKNYDIIFFYNL